MPVGHIELTRIDRRNQAASVARVLVFSGQRGKGLGRQMLTQVLISMLEGEWRGQSHAA